MTTRARSTGFTIIEFMIAMTLSLLVLAALTGAFVANSRSRTEIERANEQMENGRFALQILSDDLEMAGFYSHLDIDLALSADDPLTVPSEGGNPWPDKPSPCSVDLAGLRGALAVHMQGYDLPDDALNTQAEADALGLDCLANIDFGSDIVVVRRAATCVGGDPDCAMVATAPYFQAALCEDQLDSSSAADYFRLETTVANLNRKQRNCATDADRRQFLVHVYFVAAVDPSTGETIPTLARAELGAGPGFTIVPLARGIENLQIDYGIDTTGDGAPDVFVSSPDTYDAPGGAAGPHADCPAHASECVENWRDVVSVRLNVLARNSTTTRDYVNTKEYRLGLNDDGSDRCAKDVIPTGGDGICEPFNDGYKRHVYQTSVRLNNPAGRREQ